MTDTTCRAETIRGIFVHRDALNRHLSAPRLRDREDYLFRLKCAGHSHKHIGSRASMLLHVDTLVQSTIEGTVGEAEIETALQEWKRKRGMCLAREFRAAARSWYKFLGLYAKPHRRGGAHSEALSLFESELRTPSRYAASTITSSLPPIIDLLEWLTPSRPSLADVRLGDLEAFLTARTEAGWSRRTTINAAKSFRMFFRFAEKQGWCHASLSRTLQTPVVRRRKMGSNAPPWSQVQKMLKLLDVSEASQCRAKAILLLAAVYGLRRCEISRLQLADFDWREETVTIQRAKRGRVQQFPIQKEVGDAIICYLREVRPPSSCRNLFLTLHRPYRPATNLGPSMRKVMTATGVFEREWGLHALRHACATELLRKGTSLREVAAFLGHRDLSSVSIYARSDWRALKQVADFDLSGLI